MIKRMQLWFQQYKQRIMQYSAYAILGLSAVIGIVTRIVTLFSNGEFKGDQVRDSYVYMNMWEGVWPTLGPSSSVAAEMVYSLPPLYYYLVFPFTALGSNPVWHALPNALFSLASIPLFVYLLYRLLERVNHHKRLFLASLGGFWWALSFSDMSLAIKEWNPSPIPFFLMLFVLVASAVFTKRTKRWHDILLWAAYGLTLAVMVSLHSSAWLIMPLVAVGHVATYIIKTKKWYYPLIAIGVALLALWPYWAGEFERGWENTSALIETLQAPKEETYTFIQYVEHSVESYAQLGKLAYFPGEHIPYIASVFMFTMFLFFLVYYQGNKRMMWIFAPVWALYLYSASQYWGPLFIHYQLLIIFAPIIFAIGSLAYLRRRKRHNVVIGIIVVFMLSSMTLNAAAQRFFIASSFGADRTMNTKDIEAALTQVPAGATICAEEEPLSVYQYLDTYRTKRNLQFTLECGKNMYMIFPHFSHWHDERDRLREMIPGKYTEVEKNTVYSIYQF